MSGREKALTLLRSLPRVSLNNLPRWELKIDKEVCKRGSMAEFRRRKQTGQKGKGILPRLGFQGLSTPWYLQQPKEPYYTGQHVRREYPPLTLLQLQRTLDLGRLNPNFPIDLNIIYGSAVWQCDPQYHHGVQLTEEGADCFAAKVNIEVQFASEAAIAAIEKNGGVVTCRYYDSRSVRALIRPKFWFEKGLPIPRGALPPDNQLEYFVDPKMRGYLADPDEVAKARLELSQRYGYALPDLHADPDYEMLTRRKEMRQVFWDLQPGWIVNIHDKTVMKPLDEEVLEYNQS